MRRTRKVLFKLFYLLTLVTSIGLNAYSNYIIYPVSVGNLTETHSGMNNVNSDTGSFGEDLINQTNDCFTPLDLISPLTVSQDYFRIPSISFSIWQPPKIF